MCTENCSGFFAHRLYFLQSCIPLYHKNARKCNYSPGFPVKSGLNMQKIQPYSQPETQKPAGAARSRNCFSPTSSGKTAPQTRYRQVPPVIAANSAVSTSIETRPPLLPQSNAPSQKKTAPGSLRFSATVPKATPQSTPAATA